MKGENVQPFWRQKRLEDMNQAEWESLCDGCARCCLEKLEDEDSEQIYYTNLVCRYLDQDRCQCSDYPNRSKLVPTCVHLTPDNIRSYNWLPDTCAYRLVSEGKDLEWWHPLISGTRDSVVDAGISVKGKCISEEHVHPDQWEEHVIRWVSS